MTVVKMPSPDPSVRRSSQYGKKARPWFGLGRQLFVNWLPLVVNWIVPFESTFADEYGMP